jgi:hypothetical protein
LAIVLNLILPLALATQENARGGFDFSAAICHGGAVVLSKSTGGPGTPHPLNGVGSHDCCIACLTSLTHALLPPTDAVNVDIVAVPHRHGVDRDGIAPADAGRLSFRSRAPPIAV